MSDETMTDLPSHASAAPDSGFAAPVALTKTPLPGALREWSPTEMAFLNVYFQTLAEKDMTADDRRLRIEWMRQHQQMVKARYVDAPSQFADTTRSEPRGDPSDSDFALWIRSNLRGIF